MQGNKKKILVTGASGRVGYRVLSQLVWNHPEYQINAFDLKTKKSVKRLTEFGNKVAVVYGDITDAESVRKICTDVDIAIHLAAIIPPLAEDDPGFANKVNVEGTRNIVQQLERYSPNAFLMYSSSISVYADRIDDPYIRVGDPIRANAIGDEYTKTKIAAEQIIQSSCLDWTIFRLCGIMGEHKMSRLMFYMPLKTPMEIATAEDAARAFVHAIEKRSEVSKQIFNLGGGEQMRITYEDFLSRSFTMMGLGKVDFPPNHFAEKNFHGGHYTDSDTLEDILHFRRDTVDSYFAEFSNSKSNFEKRMIRLLRKPIKYFLAKMSDPYKAVKTGDQRMITAFFSDIKEKHTKITSE